METSQSIDKSTKFNAECAKNEYGLKINIFDKNLKCHKVVPQITENNRLLQMTSNLFSVYQLINLKKEIIAKQKAKEQNIIKKFFAAG